MKIKIVTASAGSGKTYKLTSILDEEIAAGRVEPERVMAVTFTKQAAAELVERARRKLLESGRGIQAHRLLAARIGTVNSVCGTIVTDFAFELGLSPALRVMDEAAAELEFSRAIARVVSEEKADRFEDYKHVFNSELDWRFEVRRVVEAARSNNIDAAQLKAFAERSRAELDAVLGPVTDRDLDAELARALEATLAKLAKQKNDETDVTAKYVKLCRDVQRGLLRRSGRWGDWAKLASSMPGAKSKACVVDVDAIAGEHRAHRRLRADMHGLIDLVFTAAADALAHYQDHKRVLGVIDFVDQEALALQLLRRTDVRAALEGEIDLFMVDEFQDTSPIQLAVFLELAKLAKESIWVGDPKQAIYSFRGTDPVLMDAAIESLSSDGDYVKDAATEVSKRATLETLDTSYRSRPGLVNLTSEVFARAFPHQGIRAEHTRLKPALVDDPKGLNDILQVWPLGVKNEPDRASATAHGVVRLLASTQNTVRDRDDSVRHAVPRDIAVLCRTNKQCAAVATALAQLGQPAIVPRMNLLDTHEAMVLLAGLALWVDQRDGLAAGEIARVISYPEDADAFVTKALVPREKDTGNAFDDDATVARVLAARKADPDLGPLAALDTIGEAVDIRRLCAEWGDSEQRLANIDAFRGHAASYVEQARSAGDAPTVVGMLGYLEELADSYGYRKVRQDSQALLSSGDAVTVSTWHAAKGLEWPVTVMFGLESIREASSWGTHVLSEREKFDMVDPLGGRWIRYWPFPYTTSNQNGPVRAAVESSSGHAVLAKRAAREALRVLYVGWTRARDRLIFAAQQKKMLSGILGTLSALDAGLISEPAADARETQLVTWAGLEVEVVVDPCGLMEAEALERVPGSITLGNAPIKRAPARALPSQMEEIAATIGETVTLGPRLAVRNSPEMEHVGHAVHAFLAADRPGLLDAERLAMAEELLAGFGVAGCLDAADVIASATRFWAWCDTKFPSSRLHREWPVARRLPEGTIVAGTADLVLTSSLGFALIDHKTFPGKDSAVEGKARGYAGQLHAYATGIAAATSAAHLSSWIHFPVLGQVVEVRVAP